MARKALFLSVAYLMGIQGFLICAPYLVIFGSGVHLLRMRQRRA